MEKCIFIGYPEGYKGWKFYNPETKKVIILERADFDEQYTYSGKELDGRDTDHELWSLIPMSEENTESPPAKRNNREVEEKEDDEKEKGDEPVVEELQPQPVPDQ